MVLYVQMKKKVIEDTVQTIYFDTWEHFRNF